MKKDKIKGKLEFDCLTNCITICNGKEKDYYSSINVPIKKLMEYDGRNVIIDIKDNSVQGVKLNESDKGKL